MAVDESTPIQDIKEAAKNADLIFTATGMPDLLGGEDIKQGSIVIDIGVCKDTREGGTVRGDICEEVKKMRCSFYSPVPKGVGPLTVSSLMMNTYKVWSRQL